MSERFWEHTALAEMTAEQWEALCDGCGKCCLIKLEDADDGQVYFTDVACRLLDLATCRCGDYANRTDRVPGCIRLSARQLDRLWLMPPSCSYRRLHEGRGLPDWHPLISGDRQRLHREGRSVAGRAVSEGGLEECADLEDRLVSWPALEQD